MAIATFNSLRGEKSALIMVKANPLCISAEAVYVPRAGVTFFAKKDVDTLVKGDTFEIPDGYKLEDFIDPTTKLPRTTKDGEVLKVLVY